MELALSLGDTPQPQPPPQPQYDKRKASSDRPLQLDLISFSPVPCPARSIPWLTNTLGIVERVSSSDKIVRGIDMKRFMVATTATAPADDADGGTAVLSPNSAMSLFQVDFCFGRSKRDHHELGEAERTSSRGSDDDENGSTRKKLRLSKEQSAFLEESFKEQTTLNPKQKLALAKQLNLQPRQVEVWFQNRRARTKLKQTEVDCEYLKRSCKTLTEENKRLQKELQELRALKSSHPFYMQLPATTLTMCPSCERVATNSSSAAASTTTTTTVAIPVTLSLGNEQTREQKMHD